MKSSYDVIIAGGGLAGLINAIELSSSGFSVLLIEKKSYPFHKVCGEYVSNEVKPYLEKLKIFPSVFSPPSIDKFLLSSPDGYATKVELSMGGFGISRYTFDNFLYEESQKRGVDFILNSSLESVNFLDDHFEVETLGHDRFTSKVVIGAFGKRSSLDKKMKRPFIETRTEYLAVKKHYRSDYPSDLVSLHNFGNGYCGISKVENNIINLCYLTSAKAFNSYKNIDDFEKNHMSRNPHLKEFFDKSQPVFKQAKVVSQLHFGTKELVKNHVMMCGDAAGLIHPLCGNGMAMAIHSAKLCSNQVKLFLKEKISRSDMEWNYTIEWEHQFAGRLRFGKIVQNLFGKKLLTNAGVRMVGISPLILKRVMRLSHGKEF